MSEDDDNAGSETDVLLQGAKASMSMMGAVVQSLSKI